MSDETGPVLVVEDDLALRELVILVLTDAGYDVVGASDGRVALACVARQMPKLILLDMKMPGMNGWEFARAFDARYGRQSPIVVVTAAADAEARARDIVADGHLNKPFDLNDLLTLVAKHLGGR